MAELLGPVSGFVLDDLYLTGDTVWYEEVEETIARHRPRVAVVNAGGAEFLQGGLVVMGVDDVREVAARVPTVVAVHLEALNHCFLTVRSCARLLPAVLVPADGEDARALTGLRLRLGPVVADAHVDRERRIQRVRADHLLADEVAHRGHLGLGHLEQQLVVHLEDEARGSPLLAQPPVHARPSRP